MIGFGKGPLLVAGDGKLSCSITVCLLRAGHQVVLMATNGGAVKAAIETHLADCRMSGGYEVTTDRLRIVEQLEPDRQFQLIIIHTSEAMGKKQALMGLLEQWLLPGGILAVNMEGALLSEVRRKSTVPRRIAGLNWAEPAHTTFFLEIISDAQTDADVSHLLKGMAARWDKDPYVVSCGFSIRARLVAALFREAEHLVANEYASRDDIDRACRNDAGYYLPFAGNARYMDLMGTYAYGLVMKELNGELANDRALSPQTEQLLRSPAAGMEYGAGFYTYTTEEKEEWSEKMRKFSYQIQSLIRKYPFGEDYTKVSLKTGREVSE